MHDLVHSFAGLWVVRNAEKGLRKAHATQEPQTVEISAGKPHLTGADA
jgi:hypothetical protein